jgi:hypothetical protein
MGAQGRRYRSSPYLAIDSTAVTIDGERWI